MVKYKVNVLFLFNFEANYSIFVPLFILLFVHFIEPHYNWRHSYIASEDPNSPFYNRVYSEFEFTERVYNYLIHPQWDNIGSKTLFTKILFVDYEEQFIIMEFIGEWNDAIENDIMSLKRNVIEPIMESGINKFILVGENVLNFHYSDDCYYEEWFDEVEEGWIALVNFHDHVLAEFEKARIDHYFVMGGDLEDIDWRTYSPSQFYERVDSLVQRRIG